MKLLLATTNPNKLREIRQVFAGLTAAAGLNSPALGRIDLVTIADLPAIPEPEETGTTFWENARLKAMAYARASGLTAVAEDSGLEIAALGGEPGVKSARFLGRDVPYPRRFEEIYRRLSRHPYQSRHARFVTALAVADPQGCILFETATAIDGTIADRPAGTNGFGYDPVFDYPPFGKTTAELTDAEKNSVSHRARAFRDLARWLRSPL